jgi:molybdopterin-guanine dinucleotide biosynthesis protein A
MNNSTTNTAAILKLTLAILAGGQVTREGVTKRVLVESGNGAAWYVLSMIDGPKRTRTFTSRREDAKLAHIITGEEFARWASRAEVRA